MVVVAPMPRPSVMMAVKVKAVAGELAEGVADILPEKLKAGAGAAVAYGLLDLLDAADVRKRGAARFGDRDAAGDFLVGDHLGIALELLVELAFELLSAQQIA
jgi:hypothetical protein